MARNEQPPPVLLGLEVTLGTALPASSAFRRLVGRDGAALPSAVGSLWAHFGPPPADGSRVTAVRVGPPDAPVPPGWRRLARALGPAAVDERVEAGGDAAPGWAALRLAPAGEELGGASSRPAVASRGASARR